MEHLFDTEWDGWDNDDPEFNTIKMVKIEIGKRYIGHLNDGQVVPLKAVMGNCMDCVFSDNESISCRCANGCDCEPESAILVKDV